MSFFVQFFFPVLYLCIGLAIVSINTYDVVQVNLCFPLEYTLLHQIFTLKI